MKGVVFLGDREIELKEFPDPKPGPGEVIIEMKASGMCGSDLHPYRAPKGGGAAAALGLGTQGGPFIGGHEPCGIVAERGPGVAEWEAPIGQRVMNHHYWGCGKCKHCRVGWSQLCPHGRIVYGMTGHGGHARYMKVPARTLVPLPDELSFEEGASVSCGTGTAYGALKRINASGRDTLAVFGQGPVGLSATMLGRAMGARVIAVDISPERLALAQEFGAETTINSKTTDPVAAIRDLTHGEGADSSIDCSGVSEGRQATLRCVRTWGQACFVGEGGTTSFDISNDMLRRQLTLHASWTFSTVGQEECARFIADRKIPLAKLLTHRFKLEDAPAAYKLFDTQTTGKGVFLF
ncbi:MAG: zinc-binding dehydrogenase [Candidatus Rokubacteria bacterium]|nr:zinc-binding dehydrogenase [Candidatus Rokubacteria bacterium]